MMRAVEKRVPREEDEVRNFKREREKENGGQKGENSAWGVGWNLSPSSLTSLCL